MRLRKECLEGCDKQIQYLRRNFYSLSECDTQNNQVSKFVIVDRADRLDGAAGCGRE